MSAATTGWGQLAGEIRAIAADVVRRDKPALSLSAGRQAVTGIVEHLRDRADGVAVSASADREAFRRFVEFVADYKLAGSGAPLAEEVGFVVRKVARGAPDIEGLIGSVVATLVDRERKELAYIIDVAASLSDVHGLIGMHVGRERSRYDRQSTVLDNLRPRCRQVLREPPFAEVAVVNERGAYSLRGEKPRWEPAAKGELADAVARVAEIPVVWSEQSTRASPIYSTETLRQVLAIIADSFDHAFTLDDVCSVLGRALVGYLPVFLYDNGELIEFASSYALPEDEVLGELAAQQVLEQLQGETRAAYALFLLEAKKVEIARLLGRSRPTIDERLAEAERLVLDAVHELTPDAEYLARECLRISLLPETILLVCTALLAEARGNEPIVTSLTEAQIAEAAERVAALGSEQRKPFTIEWFELALDDIGETTATNISAEDAIAVIERAVTH